MHSTYVESGTGVEFRGKKAENFLENGSVVE